MAQREEEREKKSRQKRDFVEVDNKRKLRSAYFQKRRLWRKIKLNCVSWE
jgi:hypothetical protein